jgi:hypothetical protein
MNHTTQYLVGVTLSITAICLLAVSPFWALVCAGSAVLTLVGLLLRVL